MGSMSLRWSQYALVVIGLAALAAACGQAGLPSGTLSSDPLASLSSNQTCRGTITVSLPDTGLVADFDGAAQAVTTGCNDASAIKINGPYNLTVDLDPGKPYNDTDCPVIPSAIAWDSGLIRWVVANTTGAGNLNVTFYKTSTHPQSTSGDGWRTIIGGTSYNLTFGGWASSGFTESPTSTTVNFRGGYLYAFRLDDRGRAVARQLCPGNVSNYDLVASK